MSGSFVGPATVEVVGGDLRTVDFEASSVDEASRHLPSGAYTTFRTYERTRILRLDQHFSRLEESVSIQGHAAQLDRVAVRSAIARMLAAREGESRLRLTFAPPRFFIGIEPFEPLPASLYETGVRCGTIALHRDDPHAKDTRFLVTAKTAREALGPDMHEGLMLDGEGRILEGLSSNFFALLDGALRTEGDRVLKGVTRSLVLEVAAPLLRVDERAVSKSDVPALAEALITSVSREILPVVAIDGIAIGDSRPGSITRRLMDGFRDLVAREAQPPYL